MIQLLAFWTKFFLQPKSTKLSEPLQDVLSELAKLKESASLESQMERAQVDIPGKIFILLLELWWPYLAVIHLIILVQIINVGRLGVGDGTATMELALCRP